MKAKPPPQASVLAPSTELMGAIMLHQLDSCEIEQLKADAKGYIYARTNVAVGDDVVVNIVVNSDNEVALALPYYDSIEVARANALDDINIGQVAGGEIIISTIVGAIIGFSVAAGVTGSALTVTAAASAAVIGTVTGAVIGAAVGTAVTTAAVVGGVVGSNNAKHK